MTRTISWPTREEWAAKAEHAERTSCFTWQRVSSEPGMWLSDDALDAARTLAKEIVKATRTALTRAGRADERPALNSHGRDAARDWADVAELSYDWGRIVSIANSVNAAPAQVERLSELSALMIQHRDQAAHAAEEKAVMQAIYIRNTDAGWAKELERRARVERGPMLTVHTIHEDGTSTTAAPVPYNPFHR